MLFLAVLFLFGVVAGESVCPDIKGIDNVDSDSLFENQKKWYMHLRIEDPWENGTNCNAVLFIPKEYSFTVSNVKDHKYNSFGGTYVFDKDLGNINFTSPMYADTIGDSVLSLNIVYYDKELVLSYVCNDNNGCMKEYFWACTRSRIMDEKQQKKMREQISKLNIDTSKIKKIDQSNETCSTY